MPTFKTAIDTLTVLVTDAADGGRKAISAKQKHREVVMKMYKQLGHYVEAACDGDMAKFNTSGFVAASTHARRRSRCLRQPSSTSTVPEGRGHRG